MKWLIHFRRWFKKNAPLSKNQSFSSVSLKKNKKINISKYIVKNIIYLNKKNKK